jgi:hypothetical protein
MTPLLKTTSMLLRHFFRRFFDNDTVQIEGDTTTTIARAVAIVTAPGLLVAFFLQNQYPQRSMWGRVEDQYFFVLLSFVVMGAVTIFEWEMLFPDRIDFFVLTPLPMRGGQLMIAKVLALLCFLLAFLIGVNLFGAFVYPAVCKGPFFHQLFAHTVAVISAGSFSSCAVLVIVGLLRCCLPDRLFRLVTPVVQATLTTALVLLVIQYVRYGDSVESLLSSSSPGARLIPPSWFLGLYDHLLYGSSAPAFAIPFSHIAESMLAGCVFLAIALYPLTWTRMHRMSVEGSPIRTTPPSGIISGLVHLAVRRPQERAMFHFLGQTIRRSTRYQTYLSMYAGTGLALATSCAVVLSISQRGVILSPSRFGQHAVLPLLIFWTTAGLQMAYAFPAALQARWVFRVTGSDSRDLVIAGWRWLLMIVLLLSTAILCMLPLFHWDARSCAIQVFCGFSIGFLLADAFSLFKRIPLIQPRLPGKSNFAGYLTLYIGVRTPALLCIVWAELRLELSPWLVLPILLATLTWHLLFLRLMRRPMETEEEMEGYEGDFQLLNLS